MHHGSPIHVRGHDSQAADTLFWITPLSVLLPIIPEAIARAHEDDGELRCLQRSSATSPTPACAPIPFSSTSLVCDTSTSTQKPFVQVALHKAAFHVLLHASHPGIRLTQCLLAAKSIWPPMKSDMLQWTRTCMRWKIFRHAKTQLLQFRPRDQRFYHLHVDIMGTLPLCRGQRYIWTCAGRYTRWP